MGPSLPTVAELMPIRVNEVLQYVVVRLGSAFCLTVAIKSHHIPWEGLRADFSYNFVVRKYIIVIIFGFLAVFCGICFRMWFLFRRASCFVKTAP